MIRNLFFGLCLLGLAGMASAQDARPSLFDVNGEPEKYAGQTLVFDKALMSGAVIGRGEQHELQVFNEKKAKPTDLTFSVSKELANQVIGEGLAAATYHAVELTCKIEKVNNRWHAKVSQIALRDARGQVVKVFKEGAAAAVKDNPTMFDVNAAPEKYEGKTLVFDKALLFGAVIGRGDQHELQAFNEKKAKPHNLTFSVSKQVANQVTAEGLGPNFLPVKITCKIEKVNNRWHARVQEIALLDGKGMATKVFK